MPNTYTLIEKITVGAAGASSITFTSIPQTYTDLKVVVSARTDRSGFTYDNIKTYPNGSSSNLSDRYLLGYGSGVTSATDTSGLGAAGADGASATASTFSNAEIYFPNYTSSNYKSFSTDAVLENNGTDGRQGLTASLWSNTSAITSLQIVPSSGPNFVQYTTAYLYGVAKEGVTPGTSSAPYATGGDKILFDGTYWIHTFYSSGTFTPKKGLTCDYLVVAGGGGGGSTQQYGGGGGAGGYRTSIGGTALSCSANTALTVTVGAGGASNNKGSNSVFSTITSTGGGLGGNSTNSGTGGTLYRGGTGGSGGGSGNENLSGGTGNEGGFSPVEGYAGGSVGSWPGNGAASGGGGAGAVGGNGGSNTTAGAGGNGLSNSISGSSVTYAGGGGGGNESASYGGGAGGSGGGGSGRGSGGNGSAGTVNTGGGGGGGLSGWTGGSGIVIVRYAA